MKAHGVPWLIRHLEGEISLRRGGGGRDDATRGATPSGRLTWFRNQMPDWPWSDPEAARRADFEPRLRGFPLDRAAIAAPI